MIRYLALEGIDGAGKDVQLNALARELERSGTTPIVLHEPSYGSHGRALRARLSGFPAEPDEQRRLFDLDRADHWRRKIRPSLDFVRSTEGFVILQNRSILSGAAYQSLGESDEDLVETVRRQGTIAPLPEMVALLDLPVQSALARIANRAESHDFETARNLEAVRRRYLRLGELVGECVVVNADRDPPSVTRDLLRLMGAGEAMPEQGFRRS